MDNNGRFDWQGLFTGFLIGWALSDQRRRKLTKRQIAREWMGAVVWVAKWAVIIASLFAGFVFVVYIIISLSPSNR